MTQAAKSKRTTKPKRKKDLARHRYREAFLLLMELHRGGVITYGDLPDGAAVEAQVSSWNRIGRGRPRTKPVSQDHGSGFPHPTEAALS